MSLLLKMIPQFFGPEIPPSGSGGNLPGQGKEDVIEFLGGDDEPTDVIDITDKPKDKSLPKDKDKPEPKAEPKDEEEDEDDDDDDDDDLKDIEDELEGPTDEQLELTTPVRRKEILAKYPTLFKDFPYLEKAYYREQQFTELLPTIDDAKEAVAARETLGNFEKDLVAGNTETVLKSIKETSPNSFLKIVDDYLPTLARVDERAYYHVLSNLTKHTIHSMVQEARRSNNEVLQSAAAILNQFVFGSADFKPPTNLAKDGPDETGDKKINEREQQFLQRQFDTANTDLNTRVNNTLRNTIDAHIDPKSSMSDYVKKAASNKALETIGELIGKDARFKTLTDKLWERAYKENYSKESLDRIKSAFTSRARTLLPAVIKKARNEALRGTGRRVKDDDEQNEEMTSSNRGPIASGKPRSQQPGGKITKASDIPKKMSTLDFLNS